MAIPGRLELPTYGLGNRRSVQLSYGTVLILLANFSRWCRSSDASRAAGHFLAESGSPIQAHVIPSRWRAGLRPDPEARALGVFRSPQLDRGVDTDPVGRKRVRTKDGA